MFQRFTSALFGEDVEKVRPVNRPGDSREQEEDEEDWILVNYLAEACSSECDDDLSAPTPSIEGEEEDDDDDDLVMIPSPVTCPPVRYASSTSLNSTADTDVDGGAEEDEEDESGFLRLDARSLQESWFLTPPPCFTGSNSLPILVDTSPLENLLIEHPSMSVYINPRLAVRQLQLQHQPLDLNMDLDLELELLTKDLPPGCIPPPSGKEKARHAADGPRHRTDVAAIQRRSSLHSTCYAAALSAHTGIVQPRQGNAAQRSQLPSRKVLRRLNLLRPPKAGSMHLHQPSQRHLNF
ncbi:tumor protein p53-inducible nuclear protein 1 [Gouania willdenowi]|uniref:Tumor protein p53-inducible nuclear protein 1 n=1 Tax=Gouania willdenowi TaxID=441366 RepID=A0A8C5GX60_GOUWI|nr:tumor protein p53-inducible nuclear protein 1 [Gouania willdenowi]